MKRITLGALDYGLAFGVDRTLRNLLLDGRLSAVGCMVATDLWSREFKPIQEVASTLGDKAMVGLTIALSGDRVRPLSHRMAALFGADMPSRSSLERRAMLRLLPDEIIKGEIQAQIDAYRSRMNCDPDFIAVREGLLDRTAIVKLVVSTLSEAEFSKQPVLVNSVPRGLQAARVKRIASKAGFSVLPWGPPLPETDDVEQLHDFLRHHFDGLADMTFIACLPGIADDRLRRDETLKKIAIRECQQEVLSSLRFFRTLDETNVFLN
ncbi:ChbG/HpnK family deacetylase [Roseibium algae]|uniref:ChbG/HpnK family deacetylase n=1 Tax=Roseibium algae TaxID=3123038 RepID=A0ABU8THD7_9HYPH